MEVQHMSETGDERQMLVVGENGITNHYHSEVDAMHHAEKEQLPYEVDVKINIESNGVKCEMKEETYELMSESVEHLSDNCYEVNPLTLVDVVMEEPSEPPSPQLLGCYVPLIKVEGADEFNLQSEGFCECAICNRKFSSRAAVLQHQTIHEGNTYFECLSCGEKFISSNSLTSHEKLFLFDRPHKCANCNRTFPRACHAITHYKTLIDTPTPVKTDESYTVQTLPVNPRKKVTQNKQFICKTCGRNCFKQSALVTHERIHTGEKPFICDVCGKAFSQKCHWRIHRISHNLEKSSNSTKNKHVCDSCGRTFSIKDNLIEHTREQCGGDNEKLFKCTICHKVLASQRSLIKHYTVHSVEKPFSCRICGKTFASNDNLNMHTKVHTGEKPHICSVCSKAFVFKNDLRKHERLHTGEKPYSCDFCDKSFRQKIHLKSHLIVHSEKAFICDICGKGFDLSIDLDSHRNLHNKGKTLSCELCDREFLYDSELLLHQRSHSGEKPFDCTMCGRAFSARKNLIRHNRIVHNIEE